MDINQRKEQFSRSIVQAIASTAGFATYSPSVDDDSIDIGFSGKGRLTTGASWSPRLEAQLKCSEQNLDVGEFEISFPIKLKNYDDLRVVDVCVPRILIIVMVPSEINDWLTIDQNNATIKKTCYWTSIKGSPEVSNNTQVNVRISKENLLTPQKFAELMVKVGEGEDL